MADPNFSDDKFTRWFGGMILAMIALTALLMALAGITAADVNERKQAENEMQNTESLVERISPVGKLAIGVADSIIPVANAEPRSGDKVYGIACVACHGSGVAGAPRVGDAAAWSARVAQGADLLYDHAINGYSGSAGYMPPKGGNPDLSDDEVKAAVDYMVDNSK